MEQQFENNLNLGCLFTRRLLLNLQKLDDYVTMTLKLPSYEFDLTIQISLGYTLKRTFTDDQLVDCYYFVTSLQAYSEDDYY